MTDTTLSDVLNLEKLTDEMRGSMLVTLASRLRRDALAYGSEKFIAAIGDAGYIASLADEFARNTAQALCDFPIPPAAASAASVETRATQARWIEDIRKHAEQLRNVPIEQLPFAVGNFTASCAHLIAELDRAVENRDAQIAALLAQREGLEALGRDRDAELARLRSIVDGMRSTSVAIGAR